MTAPQYNTARGTPYATGVDDFVWPQFITANRAPTSQDIYNPGTRWQDNSITPRRIYVTTGSGDWNTGSDLVVPFTAVTSVLSPYTATSTDYFISVSTTVAAVTVTLPAATSVPGRTYYIADMGGNAAVNNITISGGGTNLAGAGTSSATKVIAAAYAGAWVYSNGVLWSYRYVA